MAASLSGDDDIYADAFETSVDNLKEEISIYMKSIESLRAEEEQLEAKYRDLAKQKVSLLKNISIIYNTAKVELHRRQLQLDQVKTRKRCRESR